MMTFAIVAYGLVILAIGNIIGYQFGHRRGYAKGRADYQSVGNYWAMGSYRGEPDEGVDH